MQRRDFITSTILGVCCASELIAQPFNKAKSLPEQYLGEFVKAVDARAVKTSSISDQNLLACLTANSAAYTKTGYQKQGQQIYFCKEVNVAFMPLVLRTADTGVLDILVVFAERNDQMEWKKSGVFSGFHLEAISEYLSANTHSEKQYTNTLVPILKGERNVQYPQALATRDGYLHLHVSIQEGHASSRLEVLTNSHRLLAKHDIRSSSKLGRSAIA